MKACIASRGRVLLAVIACSAACLQAGPAQSASLYQEKVFRPFTSDHRASRVGEVLTVQVVETSQASSSADTGTRRDNNVSGSLTHQAGKLVGALGIGVKGDFDGGGRTERASKLLATLTVTVREVLPNGDLRVGGEQRLVVNDELQRVEVQGLVRPQDISDANVVVSTRLAQAQITYFGEGEVSERTRRGAWRRLVDWLGL